tara:strand:+ start:268 stop:441 length:174 start_codon:yes stop_codon:yes gene_type:complete
MYKKTDIKQYVQHCKINYLSPYNDGYTREFYKSELLRLKVILDEAIDCIPDNESKQV